MGQIYKLTFSNGKAYIGQTIHTAEIRFKGHQSAFRCNRNKSIVYSAWAKYGEPILEVLMTVEESELNNAEIEAIKFHKTLSPDGYNLTSGGEISPMRFPEIVAKIIGTKRSPEFKKACSDRMKGKPAFNKGIKLSEERKRHLSIINTGKISPHSEETKRKMSIAAKGKSKSEAHKTSLSKSLLGKPSKNKGRKISEDQKQFLSIINTGKKHSDETKEKMKAAQTKRRLAERKAA